MENKFGNNAMENLNFIFKFKIGGFFSQWNIVRPNLKKKCFKIA